MICGTVPGLRKKLCEGSMKMKILILAIVLCVVDGQTRGYKYGRQSYNARYNGYARQDPEPQPNDTVNGAQMMLFIIKTLKSLQSMFESYKWDDLYQRPDTTLQLPNKYQERRTQGQDYTGWNPWLTPAQQPPFSEPGAPTGRQTFPAPPPPPRGRSRPRRSEDSNIMPARPIRTATTPRPTPVTTTTIMRKPRA